MRTVDLEVDIGDDGRALGARAKARIAKPVATVWRLVEDVEHWPDHIPMMRKVKLDGTRASMDLQFKISVLSMGFHFVVDVIREHERSVELRYVSGEPKGIELRFDLEPDGDAACVLRSTAIFDPLTLGWLAKYFLKPHPEIQFGVIPGVATGLVEYMHRAALEGR